MKRRNIHKALLSWACLFFFCSMGNAQLLNTNDSSIYNSAVQNTIRLFYEGSRPLSRYYNGREYVRAPYKFSEGSPYFLSAEAQAGSVTYDQVFYPDVRLLFDEFLDQLIFVDETHRILLLPEKVSRFSILNDNFIRVDNNDSTKSTLSPGYYQVLFEGKLTVLKKEEKKIRELTAFSGEARTLVLDTRSIYYIKNEKGAFEITGKKSCLESMKLHQKEIQEFIKKNHLSFKRDIAGDLTKLAAFYEKAFARE